LHALQLFGEMLGRKRSTRVEPYNIGKGG
jgi:hypothetical protein